MIQITQMLTILGEHLPLVLVGGAEALVAIVLVGKTRMRGGRNRKKTKENGSGADFAGIRWKKESRRSAF